jgi:signal peptidase I
MKTGISKSKPVVILVLTATTLVGSAFLATKLSTLQIVKVEGRDMEPTLHEADRILVTSERRTLQRRDIVIFKYPADPSKVFVKRIVGLPGELLEIRAGKVSVDGKLLEEDYLDPQFNRFPIRKAALRIPNVSYYVLGDNRDNSNDSRFWGPLPRDFIDGMVLFHY